MRPERALLVGLIRVYQYGISPLLPRTCRFAPSCSEYGRQAILRHGVILGCALTAWRLLRCHPWGGCGDDPVPERFAWSGPRRPAAH